LEALLTITDFILDALARAPDGAISISHLCDLLREPAPGGRCYGKFPRFPANHSRAMDAFRALGFTVREGKRKYTWEVAL
jgi:hypothetical protein